MKHTRVAAAPFAALLNPLEGLNPLAVLGPLAGIAASLVGALPAWGADVQFTERVISTSADGAYSVFATDLDGDGDTDILSASWIDDRIAWYENDGGSPPTFTERVISTAANGARSVFATDVDGDGDIDVLSASPFDDKIAWYENTLPRCGDGLVDPDEECDDGGESATCDTDCTVAECGDVTLNVTAGEECDGGFGCTDCLCDVEFEPTAPPSLDCQPTCGNGSVDMGEECDDGNTVGGDGCSATCAGECGDEVCDTDGSDPAGYTENNTSCPADCFCGDGILDAMEECDDGNNIDGDLCSGECLIEGACCDRSPGVGGSCSVTLQDDCVGIQLVWSRGASCADALCEEGTGSCCNSDAGPLVQRE